MNTTIRNYEALYIIDANSTDEQIAASVAKYSDIITAQGGEVIAGGKWDKRRLAYEVKGTREGLYILIYFTGESNVYNELDRIFKISDDILRHLIVRIEPEQIDTKKLNAASESVQEAPETDEPTEVEETVEADDTEEISEASDNE